MAQRLRVFISSPGDVPDERLRADLVIDKLAQDYHRFFTLQAYRWEHEPMLASGQFQDVINPPSTFDIVILILWSRLGTSLPEKSAVREYRGLDGRAPITGTEWEYEDALRAARERGAPDILAFRNVSEAPVDTMDPQARARRNAQLDALDAFWRRHFADRGVFLAAYDQYSTLEEFARRLEELLRKLLERRIAALGDAPDAIAPIWLEAPFRGLEAYEFEHAAIFFGRDGLVAKAAEQLAGQARGGSAFLLVSGSSGSGKSSLVKAALLPRLMKPQRIEGAAFVRRAAFRPGDGGSDVVLGLVEALLRTSPKGDVGLSELLAPGQSAADLAAFLRGSADSPGFLFSGALARLTEAGRKSGELLAFEEAKLILTIDQFEELFTTSRIGPDDRRLFVRLLARLARSGAVWVVATMRADFWHRATEVPELVALCEGQGRIDIPPASPAELAEIIRKPAQAAGLAFELHPETNIGLDAVLAEHAAASPGVLPLLSFTLDALYAYDVARTGGHLLTYATYDALGGLQGAIATRADETVNMLPPTAQAAVPRVLRALATFTSGADQLAVARAAPLTSFPEGSDARAVVDAFTTERLVVISAENAAPSVRLAHEALISRWKRATEQLTSDRRDLETRTQVERQYARWQALEGHTRQQLLLRDPDLANALDLNRRWNVELDPQLRDFIEQSRRRSRRRHQMAAAAAVVFGLVAAAATGFGAIAYFASARAVEAEKAATAQRDEAVRQRNAALRGLESQSRFLASAADDEVKNGNVRGAIGLLRVALPDPADGNDRPLVREAISATYRALYANRERGRLALPPEATAVTTDGIGQTIVIATPNRIFVRHGLTSDRQEELPHEFGAPARIVLAPGGRRLAMIGRDGTLAVRDLQENKEVLHRAGEGTGPQVAFLGGPDRLLVISSDQTSWRLLDASTGRELGNRHFDLENGRLPAVLVDAGSGYLAVVSADHLLRLSPENLSDTAAASIDAAQEYAIALSPDRKDIFLAAAKDVLNGAIVQFDAATLQQKRAFGRFSGGASHLAVSPDAAVLAVHGLVGIDFIDAGTGERLIHVAASRDIAHGDFINKSDYLAFGKSGVVRRYTPVLGTDTGTYRTIDGGEIQQIDLLPDHSGFLTISDRPSVTNWAFEAEGISHRYSVPLVINGFDVGIPMTIEAFAVALDRPEVTAAYVDHSIRRWNLQTGELRLLVGPDANLGSVDQISALSTGTYAVIETSGRLRVYAEAGKPGTPAAEIMADPLSYLGELDATRMFAISKSGVPRVIDLSEPAAPKLIPLATLGICAKGVAAAGLAICLDNEDRLRIHDVRGDRLLIDLPSKAAARFSSAYISRRGDLLAVSWSNGELEVISTADSKTVATRKLTMKLSGDQLTELRPILSDQDRASVQRGVKELVVAAGANALSISDDDKHLAIGMPDRTVLILDLPSGESHLLRNSRRALPQELHFSPKGDLLATVEAREYTTFNVYDVDTGQLIANDLLRGQPAAKLTHLDEGKGFATIDKSGSIIVHPMFPTAEDLVAYLRREFPEKLTAEQRRVFFIE